MQQTDETAALRELAERLIGLPFPFGGGAEERPRLIVASLPADLPMELPVPPGGRLLGSAVRNQSLRPGAPATGLAMDIVLDAVGEGAAILQFYEQEFTKQGWSVRQGAMHPPFGGFETIRMPPSRTFCKSVMGPSASVRVLAQSGGTSDVRVHVDTSGPGPCAVPEQMMPPFAGLLPTLTAPAGVTMEQLSAGGGSGGWSSTALATTDRACGELEAHFASEFEGAGWLRQDGAENGPLAWSSWTSSSKEGWRAFLLVAEEPANRRLLHARVELIAGGGFGGRGSWAGRAVSMSSRFYRIS